MSEEIQYPGEKLRLVAYVPRGKLFAIVTVKEGKVIAFERDQPEVDCLRIETNAASFEHLANQVGLNDVSDFY